MHARVSFVLAAVLAACGSELPIEEEAGALTVTSTTSSPYTFTQPQLVTPDRMLWNNGGDGELWWLTSNGRIGSTRTYTRNPDWTPASVAGNRLLWHRATLTGHRTELWTLDAYNNPSYIVLASPAAGARAVSLSLAQTYLGECWQLDDEQRYLLLWDAPSSWEHPYGQFIVQLIDGGGYPLRTTFTDKPMSGLAAVAFGKASDAWEHVVFRGNDGAAWIYTATLVGGTSYQLGFLRTERVSGYRFAAANVKYYNTLLEKGWRDQLLFTSATGTGEAIVRNFDWQGTFRWQESYTAAPGMLATSRTSLPAVCQ
jgi:hypothetical protein